MNYTRHAETRAQQRGIPPFIVDIVIENGHSARRRGADVYFLDQRDRKALRKKMGKLVYRRLEDLFDAYVVMGDDGRVITCGHRYRRIPT